MRRSRRPDRRAVGPLGDLQDSRHGEGLAGRGDAEGPPERAGRRLQGRNSWPDGDNIGYRGPMPPPGHGVHHYYFKLYALDAPIEAEPSLDKKAVLEKIRDHVLAEGVLMGTYQR